MSDLKTIKQRARGVVKRHYVLVTLLCAISIFVGTDSEVSVVNLKFKG